MVSAVSPVSFLCLLSNSRLDVAGAERMISLREEIAE